MLIDDVVARLKAEVAALDQRVEGAAELSELVAAGKWPQRTPACWVLPLGFNAGNADAVTGMFTQMLSRSVGVVLFTRAAGDATGAKSLAGSIPYRSACRRASVRRSARCYAAAAH